MFSTRLVVTALVVLTTLAVVGSASDTACQPRETWLSVEANEHGYEIRAKDPDRIRRSAPDFLSCLLIDAAEQLAGFAHTTVFYVQHGANIGCLPQPIPVDGVWAGPDPLSALRSFCSAGGFEVRVIENGVWLVGPPSDLDVSAVVAFTYPMANDAQRRLDPDEERALLRDLPVRVWEANSTHDEPDLRWVGLGYYRHPTEPGVVMLMVTEGVNLSDPGVVGSLMKVVLEDTPSGPIARCLWISGAWGKPVPHFAEDVDGDGVTDMLVSGDVGGGWPDRWDLLVSGSDGHELAEFGTELVAVEQKPSGPRRIAVKYVRSKDDYPIARLLTYSSEKAGFVTATTQADEDALRQKAEGKNPALGTVGRLLAEVKEPSLVKAYLLPGMRPSEHVPEGVEVIPAKPYHCWFTWVVPGDRDLTTLDERRKKCPDVNLLINYAPEGYTKAYAAFMEAMLAGAQQD